MSNMNSKKLIRHLIQQNAEFSKALLDAKDIIVALIEKLVHHTHDEQSN